MTVVYIFSGLIIVLGIILFIQKKNWENKAGVLEAVVTDVDTHLEMLDLKKERTKEDPVGYNISYTFEVDKKSYDHTAVSRNTNFRNLYTNGDKITVLYNIENPHDNYPKECYKYYTPIGYMVTGLLFIVISTIINQFI